MNIFISNTNVLTLQRLKSSLEPAYIDDAEVSLTIVKADGSSVEGQTWPIAMQAVNDSPSKGDYRAVLSADIVLLPNASYLAVIDVDAGENRIGHWEIRFVAKIRQ
jgi:hypothetical protein